MKRQTIKIFITMPKLKYFRSNSPLFEGLQAEVVSSTSIHVTGKIIFFKNVTSKGVCYRPASGGSWKNIATETNRVDVTIANLSPDTEYIIELYVKRGVSYDRSKDVEVSTLPAEEAEE